MPGFDRSGPKGQGSATGKKRGMCPRTDYSAFANVDRGRGRGLGIGQVSGAPEAFRAGRKKMQTDAVERVEREDDLESLKKQYESARKMMEELQEKITAMETQQK